MHDLEQEAGVDRFIVFIKIVSEVDKSGVVQAKGSEYLRRAPGAAIVIILRDGVPAGRQSFQRLVSVRTENGQLR